MNEAVVTFIIQVISSYTGGSCPHVPPLVLPVDTVGLWVRDLCTEEPDSGLLPRGAFQGTRGLQSQAAPADQGRFTDAPEPMCLPWSLSTCMLNPYCVGIQS